MFQVIDVEAAGEDRIVTEKVNFSITTKGGKELLLLDGEENRITFSRSEKGDWRVSDLGTELPSLILGRLLGAQRMFMVMRCLADGQDITFSLNFPDDVDALEWTIKREGDGALIFQPVKAGRRGE